MFTTFNARFIIGIIFIISAAHSASSQENKNAPRELTVIKQWQENDTLNGEFEESRRVWLASLRKDRDQLKPARDEIFIEKLEIEVTENEFSQETLKEFVEKIGEEVNEN